MSSKDVSHSIDQRNHLLGVIKLANFYLDIIILRYEENCHCRGISRVSAAFCRILAGAYPLFIRTQKLDVLAFYAFFLRPFVSYLFWVNRKERRRESELVWAFENHLFKFGTVTIMLYI